MSIKKLFKHASFLLLITFIGIQATWAADLDSAKSGGLIGELPNGYLGLVVENAPSDVKALIKEVNQKRKAKYMEVAQSRNLELSKVETIAGEKAFEKTLPGNYIQVNGKWVKK